MAKTFRYQHLRSLNHGTKPSTSVIREGEIAVNLADEKMFLKNTSGVIVDFISEPQIDSKISNLSGAVDTKVERDIEDFFDGAVYDSENSRINFKHGEEVKAYIDTTDFVKDGMIDNVEVKDVDGVTCLVITFNTDSGKEDINIPIADLFDAANYYTKDEVNTLLDGKVSNDDFDEMVASAITNNQTVQDAIDDAVREAIEDSSQVSAAVETIVDAKLVNYYNKTEINETTDSLSGAIDSKQEELVSGTNIKTVLNNSLLGEGNLDIAITDLSGVIVDGDYIILDSGYYE